MLLLACLFQNSKLNGFVFAGGGVFSMSCLLLHSFQVSSAID